MNAQTHMCTCIAAHEHLYIKLTRLPYWWLNSITAWISLASCSCFSADSQPDSEIPDWLLPFTTHFLNYSPPVYLDPCVRTVQLVSWEFSSSLSEYSAHAQFLLPLVLQSLFRFKVTLTSIFPPPSLSPQPFWRVCLKNFVIHLESLISLHYFLGYPDLHSNLFKNLHKLHLFLVLYFIWVSKMHDVTNSPLRYCTE